MSAVVATPIVVQQHPVSDGIRSLSTLSMIDYEDLFTVTAPRAAQATPDRWARVTLEGASPTARFIVWQVFCGLELERQPSPDHIAGWKVSGRDVGWIRSEAESWFMTAEAILLVEAEQVSIALFIRYKRPAARLIWGTLSVVHRRAMPGLLRAGVVRMNRARH